MKKTKFKTRELRFDTKRTNHIINITSTVKAFVKENGIRNGILNIQTYHTTAIPFIGRKKEKFVSSMKKYLDFIAPRNGKVKYDHDNLEIRTENIICGVNGRIDECINGHSHLKASLLPVNVIVAVVDGKLKLEQGQNIYFIELDQSRKRNLLITFTNSNSEKNEIVYANNTPVYNPGGHYFFNDITTKVQLAVKRSGVENGHVHIRTLHNSRSVLGTSAILVNEKETGFTNDLRKLLVRVAKEKDYVDFIKKLHRMIIPTHTERCLLPTSATLSIVQGRLKLGQWQTIFSLTKKGPINRAIQITIKGE